MCFGRTNDYYSPTPCCGEHNDEEDVDGWEAGDLWEEMVSCEGSWFGTTLLHTNNNSNNIHYSFFYLNELIQLQLLTPCPAPCGMGEPWAFFVQSSPPLWDLCFYSNEINMSSSCCSQLTSSSLHYSMHEKIGMGAMSKAMLERSRKITTFFVTDKTIHIHS